MNITGKITGIKYKVLLAGDLETEILSNEIGFAKAVENGFGVRIGKIK